MGKFLGYLRRTTLTQWIFVGLVAGLVIGAYVPSLVPVLKPFRGLFLNGVKCIVAPLIFSTIVTGIAGAGSFKQLGLMGLRAFIYFEAATTAALVIGLVFVNGLAPGVGLSLHGFLSESLAQTAASKITLGTFLEHLLPPNIADAVVRGDTLQVVMFSTFFGFAALSLGERARPVVEVCESLAQLMFRFTGLVMWLAPLGVGAALALSVHEHGWQVILPLLKLLGTLYGALVVFIAVVLVPVCRLFGIPLKAFARQVKAPVFLAFATSSSESAYPLALEALENFGIPRRISSFVLPLGYSFNLDGSTLYLAVASLFLAQASGLSMPLDQQLLMMVTLLLTSKGVAAVPRAGIVVLSGAVTSFGIPLEGITLLLAVDVFMDMARTSVNVFGNCLASAVIARWEGIPLPGAHEVTVASATVAPVPTGP